MRESHGIYFSVGLPCLFTLPAALRTRPFPTEQQLQQRCPNPEPSPLHSLSLSLREEHGLTRSLQEPPSLACHSGSFCILLVPTLPTASPDLGVLQCPPATLCAHAGASPAPPTSSALCPCPALPCQQCLCCHTELSLLPLGRESTPRENTTSSIHSLLLPLTQGMPRATPCPCPEHSQSECSSPR